MFLALNASMTHRFFLKKTDQKMKMMTHLSGFMGNIIAKAEKRLLSFRESVLVVCLAEKGSDR